MPQHDYVLDDANGATFLADLNDALSAIRSGNSGAGDPPAMVAHMVAANTSLNVTRRRNAANNGWILEGTLAQSLVSTRTSNTALGPVDFKTSIIATGTFTQTLTAAASLGVGWWCDYMNEGAGTITLDPNGSETIEGVTAYALHPGMAVKILCTGSAFKIMAANMPTVYCNLAGDGTNESAKLKAKIDAMPNTGGLILLPNKVLILEDIPLQGTAGTKTNIIVQGQGDSTNCKAPTGSSKNVFKAGTGTRGCGVMDMKITGSRGNGGAETLAPNRGLAAAGMVLVVDDRVEVTSSDTYTTSVLATNRVYRCTVGVTLGATFSTHLASFALTAEPNFNAVDITYGENNGVYFDDCEDCFGEGVTVENTIYGGFSIGSGPVQAANAGPGTDRVRLSQCKAIDCGNGYSGGKARDADIDVEVVDSVHYGGVIDVGAADITVRRINARGCGNTALFVYNAVRVTIGSVAINACLNGIVVDNGSSFVSVGDGTINGCTNVAMLIRNSNYASVGAIRASGNVAGVQFEQLFELDISNLTVDGTTGAGQSGIKLTSCSLVALGLVSAHNNNLHGIELISCDQVTFSSGCKFFDNNTSANANGAGIHGHDTTNVTLAPGLRSRDTRAGPTPTEFRKQQYGVRTTGTSSNWKLIYTELAGNITANHSMVGSNTVV